MVARPEGRQPAVLQRLLLFLAAVIFLALLAASQLQELPQPPGRAPQNPSVVAHARLGSARPHALSGLSKQHQQQQLQESSSLVPSPRQFAPRALTVDDVLSEFHVHSTPRTQQRPRPQPRPRSTLRSATLKGGVREGRGGTVEMSHKMRRARNVEYPLRAPFEYEQASRQNKTCVGAEMVSHSDGSRSKKRIKAAETVSDSDGSRGKREAKVAAREDDESRALEPSAKGLGVSDHQRCKEVALSPASACPAFPVALPSAETPSPAARCQAGATCQGGRPSATPKYSRVPARAIRRKRTPDLHVNVVLHPNNSCGNVRQSISMNISLNIDLYQATETTQYSTPKDSTHPPGATASAHAQRTSTSWRGWRSAYGALPPAPRRLSVDPPSTHISDHFASSDSSSSTPRAPLSSSARSLPPAFPEQHFRAAIPVRTELPLLLSPLLPPLAVAVHNSAPGLPPTAHLPSPPVPAPTARDPSPPLPALTARLPSPPLPAPTARLPSPPLPAPTARLPSPPLPAPTARLPSPPLPALTARLPSPPLPAPTARLPSPPLPAPTARLPSPPLPALTARLPSPPLPAPTARLPSPPLPAPTARLSPPPLPAPSARPLSAPTSAGGRRQRRRKPSLERVVDQAVRRHLATSPWTRTTRRHVYRLRDCELY